MENRNDWAWQRKESLAERAGKLYQILTTKYQDQINHGIAGTKLYDGAIQVNLESKYSTETEVMDKTTVGALFDLTEDNVAILNFASYKNPGGMFLKGSMAQEESLCHNSTLYPVLEAFEECYYKVNRQYLNRSLYSNKALFSKDILFHTIKDGKRVAKHAAIITCAAPNKFTAQKFQNVSDEECVQVLKDRMRFVLRIAAKEQVEVLILGAWGCGVFGNDAEDVAKAFKEIIEQEFSGVFKRIIHPIPAGPNLEAFKKVY